MRLRDAIVQLALTRVLNELRQKMPEHEWKLEPEKSMCVYSEDLGCMVELVPDGYRAGDTVSSPNFQLATADTVMGAVDAWIARKVMGA